MPRNLKPNWSRETWANRAWAEGGRAGGKPFPGPGQLALGVVERLTLPVLGGLFKVRPLGQVFGRATGEKRLMTGRHYQGILGIFVLGLSAGCSLAPKSFVQSNDPAPLVRARSMALNQSQPDSVMVPALIARLNDPDAVVRMTASEELKRRTGQDFNYAPWEDEQGRAQSMMAWQNWWKAKQGGVTASPQLASRRPVIVGSAQPKRKRRWGNSRIE